MKSRKKILSVFNGSFEKSWFEGAIAFEEKFGKPGLSFINVHFILTFIILVFVTN